MLFNFLVSLLYTNLKCENITPSVHTVWYTSINSYNVMLEIEKRLRKLKFLSGFNYDILFIRLFLNSCKVSRNGAIKTSILALFFISIQVIGNLLLWHTSTHMKQYSITSSHVVGFRNPAALLLSVSVYDAET